MSTLRTLAERRTDLSEAEVDHLHAVVAEWALLADLSFADLLLFVRDGEEFVTVAQLRPSTGQTIYHDDMVGTVVAAGERFLADRAWREGRICREGDPEWESGVPVRQEAIPVRYGDRVIAVVSRDSNLASARVPSQLEMTYLQTAGDLAQMVAQGTFPVPGAPPDSDLVLRVGDGMLRLDADGVVTYASPNALSAYRRLGIARNLVGEHLGDLGLDDKRVYGVLDTHLPADHEVDANGAVVARRAIPLLDDGTVIGALVLVRDITDLRRRDRQLLTLDATIREIHHRVKNNLQTVAALLRLQARRSTAPEARSALEESVRRVSSIALVHETLSQALDDAVEFDEIADKVMAMVGDVASPERSVTTRRVGSSGLLPAAVATPLALVLAEVLQNAAEHAFGGSASGTIEVRLDRRPTGLRVEVVDDGGGLPEGFAIEGSTRLGLQIVRTLVVGELGGAIEMGRNDSGGTSVVLDLPLATAAH
ncbi:MAG: two-component system, sensor histidine kinase PdtaS [Frankiaceae bacterium]|nr:two-component system, sensor histidine kinase PdtaS [Frankiaceae bacterium]